MANPMEKIGIHFGALSQPIHKQLGIKRIDEDLKHLQEDADAVTRLAVRGLLADSVVRKTRQKIMKEISKYLSTRSKS
jgi:hypothetical protein